MSNFDKHFARWQDFPKSAWRWPNFSAGEVACRDGSLMVNESSMDKLQALREKLGKPILLNSAYRSPPYNRRIGGASRSQHLKARAFDVRMSNHDPQAFEDAAREVGFTGFGFYPKSGFMHIDTGRPREWGERFAPRDDNAFHAPEKPTPGISPGPAEKAKDSTAGVVIGGGAVAAGGSVIGTLGENAQLVVVVGLMVAGLAALFLFRHQIARLLGKSEDI